MAVVFTYDFPTPVRIEKGQRLGLAVITGTMSFDNSYATGGKDVSALTGKFATCHRIICDQAGGYVFQWDKTNKKMKVLTPVSAVAAHSHTENTAAAYTQNATTATAGAITAAAASEVANTTDLSGLTAVSFIAVGVM